MKKEKTSNTPDAYDYTFNCKCKQGKKEVVVTAANDNEAQKKAIEACKKACGQL